jgi:hypothetical protein
MKHTRVSYKLMFPNQFIFVDDDLIFTFIYFQMYGKNVYDKKMQVSATLVDSCFTSP